MPENELTKKISGKAGERKVEMTKRTLMIVSIGSLIALLACVFVILKVKTALTPELVSAICSPILTILGYFLFAIGTVDGTFKAANVGEHMAHKN